MASPLHNVIQLTTGNLNRDGTGAIVDGATGALTVGQKLDRIRVQAIGATTAGAIHMYVKKSGGSYRFHREWKVPAQAPGASISPWSLDLDCSTNSEAVYLMNGDVVAFATDKSETFNVFVLGG